MNKPLPSLEYLRECFVYDSDSGELRWKVRPKEHFNTAQAAATANTRFSGKRAGSPGSLGYYDVCINFDRYLVHRIIWKMVTGKEPVATLDHRDGNPSNNCFANLREASRTEQTWNARIRIDNTTGYCGVYRCREKWASQITFDGVTKHLGVFDTKEEAAAAREAAARKLHGKFYLARRRR
jgi:hypothetical protein